jgi:hypothetical protein
MIPFEIWISADDRQNASNVLVGIEQTGEATGAWIDYAFSLDHTWKGNNHLACALTPLYPPVGPPDTGIMKSSAQRIAAVDNSTVEAIINRIPPDYLPRGAADNIIRNLLSRRPTVSALWP